MESEMPRMLKVTAFVTRRTNDRLDLLLFEHPYAGVQIPAGTVHADETPEQAARREVAEESGLTSLSVCCSLGCADERLPAGKAIISQDTKVYSRPDGTSFDYAHLPAGRYVTLERSSGGFVQVTHEEFDRVPDPQYVTMCITGWVPGRVLADTQTRHFFHLVLSGGSAERWTVFADNHNFNLFWAPMTTLPEIIPPQDQWVALLERHITEAGCG